MGQSTARAASRPRLVVNNSPKPGRIAPLIAAHKAATKIANRAQDALDAFPQDLQEEARVQVGLLHTHDKGEPAKVPLFTSFHNGIDKQLEGWEAASAMMGPAAFEIFEARRAKLHTDLDEAMAAKKAARDAAGYSKAERNRDRTYARCWRAQYALTGVTPANMAEMAELAAYLRLLISRKGLSDYMLKRALTAMANATTR